MRCELINRFFNGLLFSAILVVALALSAAAFHVGGGDAHDYLPLMLNIAGILATGAMLYMLNKTFSFIRSVTAVNVSTFLMLEAANPYLSAGASQGTLLCIVVMAATFIMFNAYNRRDSQRSIYLTFALLMLGSMFQYSCAFLIPVFILGFMQMRAMTLKGFLAMGVGLLTPPWILFGLGILSFSTFEISSTPNVWEGLPDRQMWTLLVAAIASVVLVLALMALNLMHIYSYKTQIRAYNGFFSILALATIIMMAVDYDAILSYLPLLNCCLAIQMAHTFTISTHPRRFIAVALLLVACAASYSLFLTNSL